MATIRNLMVRLGIDFSERGLTRATRSLTRFEARLNRVGRLSAGGVGLTALAGGAASLGAALTPVVASLTALPGNIAATKAATATLRVGLIGVGDAMSAIAEDDAKALNEALEKLSPNARAFVKEAAQLKGAFNPVQQAVQDRLFAGLADQMRPAASTLLPTVRRGMLGVAGAMNAAARQAIAWAKTPVARGAISTVFASTERTTRRLTGAVQPFLTVVSQLTVKSLPLVERMVGWATTGVKAAAAFFTSERGAALLSSAVQRAGDRLEMLGRIGRNIAVGLAAIFKNANETGVDFLGTLEQLTARFAAWAQSARGQQQAAEVFRLLGQSAHSLATVLPVLMGPLGAIVHLLSMMPAPARGVVVQLLAVAAVIGLLTSRLALLSRGLTFMVRGFTLARAAVAGVALQAGIMTARTAAMTVAQKAAAVASRAWAAAQWLVNAAMRANPIGLVITVLTALVGAIVLAYSRSETFRRIVQGAWRGIQVAVSFAWNNVIRPVFNALVRFITGTLAPRVMWLYNSVIRPAFSRIGQAISFAWNRVIRPVFNTLRTAITSTIPGAFRSGVNAIKRFWDRLIGIAKTPVNFVIRFYNQGVAALVNKLAEFVGIKSRLPAIRYFAKGGVMPGYAPGRDTLLAAVSPGESIFRPEFTRAVGSKWVEQANKVARRSGVAGVRRWIAEGHPIGAEGLAFARGGIVPRFAGRFALGGIIGRFVQGVKDFTIGNVARGARTLLNKVLGVIPGGGMLRRIIAAIPPWIINTVVKWIGDKVTGGVGGPAVQRALRFARSQAGKPYVWGGVGPAGYDCSGLISAITNVIKGRYPYRRLFTTFSFTGATNGPAGFVRNLRSGFMVGITNAGVGHMAGTLGGVNVESRGSRGVVVGPAARGANSSLFTMRYGLRFDKGGVMPPGYGAFYNGTRKPEYVFTDRQIRALAGTTVQVTVNVPPVAHPHEVGKAVYEVLEPYMSRSGRRLPR